MFNKKSSDGGHLIDVTCLRVLSFQNVLDLPHMHVSWDRFGGEDNFKKWFISVLFCSLGISRVYPGPEKNKIRKP